MMASPILSLLLLLAVFANAAQGTCDPELGTFTCDGFSALLEWGACPIGTMRRSKAVFGRISSDLITCVGHLDLATRATKVGVCAGDEMQASRQIDDWCTNKNSSSGTANGTCVVPVSPNLFNDLCPGTAMYLRVCTYCAKKHSGLCDLEDNKKVICQGDTSVINWGSCPAGQIRQAGAWFGRLGDRSTCSAGKTNVELVTCGGSDVSKRITTWCNRHWAYNSTSNDDGTYGKCTIPASDDVFLLNNCPTVHKYLEVCSYCHKPSIDDCKMTKQGLSYAGNIAITRSGLPCQPWTVDTPHSRSNAAKTLSNYPDTSLADAANYCRNPDSFSDGPWCYTMDPNTSWEFCDIKYCADREVLKYVLSNVQYQLDGATKLTRPPSTVGSTTITNRGSVPQKVSEVVSGEWTDQYSWNNNAGMEVGASVTAEAGIPGFGSVSATVSATASYSHEWGGFTTETKSKSIQRDILVPARCTETVFMLGRRFVTSVPYTATLETIESNGNRVKIGTIEGMFRGVTVSSTEIQYSEISIDNSTAVNCGTGI